MKQSPHTRKDTDGDADMAGYFHTAVVNPYREQLVPEVPALLRLFVVVLVKNNPRASLGEVQQLIHRKTQLGQSTASNT